MPNPLLKDTELTFPNVTVITASAGSGKTHTLTMRYISFLLSEKIQFNDLRNVLAITFTNNAAFEMKQRIIGYLKMVALGNKDKTSELRELVPLSEAKLRNKASLLLDRIFDEYSDFQVKTIDSFMTSVFKSSALEFGYNPGFDISVDSSILIDYAFDLFLRDIQPGTHAIAAIEKSVRLLSKTRSAESSYIWNPYKTIGQQVEKLFGTLGSVVKSPAIDGQYGMLDTLKEQIAVEAVVIEKAALESGLETKSNTIDLLQLAKSGDVETVGARAALVVPLKKPKTKREEQLYRTLAEMLQPHCDSFNGLVVEYIRLSSRMYYLPYLECMMFLRDSLERAKKQIGRIFIDEVSKKLSDYLREDIIPDVYFKLGEKIYHYLIDEFQDTSPIQWANIKMLVENSLASHGSLFLVGDTKQAIYGFRGADWTIMAELTKNNIFPSAFHQVLSLDHNYRSFEKIVAFNEEVFQRVVSQTDYAAASQRSGLATYRQDALKENKGKGIVEVHLVGEDEEVIPEKIRLLEILKGLYSRGYQSGEIAVLTPANGTVIEIGGWLNEQHIPFVSHSSLDIRRRRVVGDIIALLKFLDSPVDDISFLAFIAGNVFQHLRIYGIPDDKTGLLNVFASRLNSRQRREPLYRTFRDKFPEIWNEYFEELFNLVGYLPLYDLISAIYKTFNIFETCGEDEASFIKLLDVAKIFENSGKNNLRDFLSFAGDDDESGDWKIDVPENLDAVRLMTIHKSKGLQFRVVIVLLYDKRETRNDYYIAEEGDSISVLHINKAMANRVPSLGEIYEEQKIKNQVNELNSLYVAFTRAREEMYVIGVYDKEPKVPTSFLPETLYLPGAKGPIVPSSQEMISSIRPYHHRSMLRSSIITPSSPASDKTKRGEIMHLILSKIRFYDEVPDIESIIEKLGIEIDEAKEKQSMANVLKNFLSLPDVREFFLEKPSREVLIEQDVVDRSGRLFRIDRVVIDKERIVIVDFKTGGDDLKEMYAGQISNYMRLIKEIYRIERVSGVFAYIDLGKLEVIS
jgi:ATP-dependent exoDNAse (exonuclease V) beta subunit